jgi:hypothetical protein
MVYDDVNFLTSAYKDGSSPLLSDLRSDSPWSTRVYNIIAELLQGKDEAKVLKQISGLVRILTSDQWVTSQSH